MPDPPQTERNTGLAVQLGLQLSQRQIGFRRHPIHHLTLRLRACPPLTPRLVRHALGLPSAVPLCGNLFRPAHAHQEAIRKFLQRRLALIVGQQKLTAQVIPIWLRHRFTRRRVSPNVVYTIKENALDHSKSAVLDSLRSPESKRGYRHAIDEFIQWYCSGPRLSFNKVVVTRYQIFLENRQLAAGTINGRLAAVRRLAYEAADAGLLSPELAASIRRVKGVRKLGVRLGNWLTAEEARRFWQAP